MFALYWAYSLKKKLFQILYIFSQQQKVEFKRFNLVQNTRQLIKEEIVHKMYPAEVLSRINEDTSLDEISTNDFISYNLQEYSNFLGFLLNMRFP